jgi:hypothetical protein
MINQKYFTMTERTRSIDRTNGFQALTDNGAYSYQNRKPPIAVRASLGLMALAERGDTNFWSLECSSFCCWLLWVVAWQGVMLLAGYRLVVPIGAGWLAWLMVRWSSAGGAVESVLGLKADSVGSCWLGDRGSGVGFRLASARSCRCVAGLDVYLLDVLVGDEKILSSLSSIRTCAIRSFITSLRDARRRWWSRICSSTIDRRIDPQQPATPYQPSTQQTKATAPADANPLPTPYEPTLYERAAKQYLRPLQPPPEPPPFISNPTIYTKIAEVATPPQTTIRFFSYLFRF